MFKQVVTFAKHQLTAKSKKGFGIHSPFLFHLVSEIINDFTPYYCYEPIENQRQRLLSDNTKITVTDLGLGSKSLKQNTRKISNIAKTSLKTRRLAQLIFRIVNYFQPNTLLELGTSLGITTSYLASFSSQSKVISIEGCPEIGRYAKQTFDILHLNNIDLKIGNINTQLLASLHELKTVDFVFFDGNHKKEATLQYFKQCLDFINPKTVFVFDDIYLTDEMQEAWQEIIHNEKVSASLNLYYMGLVFFRLGMSREHLKIRF